MSSRSRAPRSSRASSSPASSRRGTRQSSSRCRRATTPSRCSSSQGWRAPIRGPCHRSTGAASRARRDRGPGDFSSSAPFVVAAVLLPGSEVVIRGVNLNPRRTGLLAILGRMGARIDAHDVRDVCGEPAGDLVVRTRRLSPPRSAPTRCRSRSTSSRSSHSRQQEHPGRASSPVRPSSAPRKATGSTPSSRVARARSRDRGDADGFRVHGEPGRLAAVRSRAMATTGSRCSRLSPGSPRETAWTRRLRCDRVSFPGFFEMLDAPPHLEPGSSPAERRAR